LIPPITIPLPTNPLVLPPTLLKSNIELVPEGTLRSPPKPLRSAGGVCDDDFAEGDGDFPRDDLRNLTDFFGTITNSTLHFIIFQFHDNV